ncbi:metallophosphoesterase [Xylanibacillus composti]|uniref:Serine/threonine protein phosphatase n=1 Tax=Xylanibacillus composti TaxID=1572762 RepID=A0A8J4H2J3_9BACL|nr:metallophosphoesterase family protein [Xylanibacillus composti]MDT9724209.1 metallophosphoesterase [Xylanibacillus composti]GIQ68276.1 serine/threonine protein phosphatase [Xylanibacillus composti]
MDRIAIIADIHGNIPALDAVLADIAGRSVDRIYCLGDLVGKGPQPELAVDRIRELCDIVVRGNWDESIGLQKERPHAIWQQARLGEERMRYLRELPFSFDFLMSGRRIRLLHASPQSLYHRVQPWDDISLRAAMFANTEWTAEPEQEPDVVGYGDIHHAYMQHLQHKLLFNTGSVGNPLDMPEPSYVIMEGLLEQRQRSALSIQFIRVPYDIEEAVRLAEQSDMPESAPYVIELRTAVYRGMHQGNRPSG